MDFKSIINKIASMDEAVNIAKSPELPKAVQLNEDAELRVLSGRSTYVAEAKKKAEAEKEKPVKEELKVGEKKKSSTGGTIEKTKTGVKHTAGKNYGGEAAEKEDKKKSKKDESIDTEAFRGKFAKMVEAKKKGKPDFLDIDGDGDKKEPMKKAAADKKKGSAPKKGVNPFAKKKTVKESDDGVMAQVAKMVNDPSFTSDDILKIVDGGPQGRPDAPRMDDLVSQYIQKEFEELQYDLGREYEDMPEEVAEKLILQLRQQTQESVSESTEKRAPAKKAEREVELPSGAKVKATKVQGWQSQKADKESNVKESQIDELSSDTLKSYKAKTDKDMYKSVDSSLKGKDRDRAKQKDVNRTMGRNRADDKILKKDLDGAFEGKKSYKKTVKESVETKLTFKEMARLVIESGGQQQIDPLDKELFAWANRVANSKLGEGTKAELYAGLVYERMGGRFEMYDVLSEDKK